MGYLNQNEISLIKDQIASNESYLGRLKNAKKVSQYKVNINPNELQDYLKDGYFKSDRKYATKVQVIKNKAFQKQFEDDIWCMLYGLGFRKLNIDENFKLKYGKNDLDWQQIDAIAVNNEVAILVECKASEKSTKVNYKSDIESLPIKIAGYRKCINEVFGPRRLKYVFATRNQIVGDADCERLIDLNIFHIEDNAFAYINSLIKNYKGASIYQFLGMMFKGEIINNDPIDIPAISGKMGGKNYYMFSIEPGHLLKIGFVLHRTRTYEREDPTYQRLLVPSRLKSISKFIDDKGFFPNSIIINFNTKDLSKKISFIKSSSKNIDSRSRHGVLQIPNSFSIAYIIDGQHRLYGYANTDRMFNSTIPCVAFENLESEEQLKMFMDINENQKKISKSLRLTLDEDIYWKDDNIQRRMKALRSGILNRLSDQPGPLKDILSGGEDRRELSPDFISNALTSAPGLLPKVNKNELVDSMGILYNISNQKPFEEMSRVKKYISDLITEMYTYIRDNYEQLWETRKSFVRSNKGTYALVYILGSLNRFLTEQNELNLKTSVEDRFSIIAPYLDLLLKTLDEHVTKGQDPYNVLKIEGSRAKKAWSMFFESVINVSYPEFETDELVSFKETQDEELQGKGKKIVDVLELLVKDFTLKQLKALYGKAWHLKINNEMRKACSARASDEESRIYNESEKIVKINWTDMFMLSDYLKMIKTHWGKTNNNNVISFSNQLSLDITKAVLLNNKKTFKRGTTHKVNDGLKWLLSTNILRNNISHPTKNIGLTRDDVEFIETVYNSLEVLANYHFKP